MIEKTITTKELPFTDCNVPGYAGLEFAPVIHINAEYKLLDYEKGFDVNLFISRKGNNYGCSGKIIARGLPPHDNSCLYTIGDSLTESHVNSILYQLKENITDSVYYTVKQQDKKTDYEDEKESKKMPTPYSVGRSLAIVSNNKPSGETVIVESVHNNEHGTYYNLRNEDGVTFVMPHYYLNLLHIIHSSFYNKIL